MSVRVALRSRGVLIDLVKNVLLVRTYTKDIVARSSINYAFDFASVIKIAFKLDIKKKL